MNLRKIILFAPVRILIAFVFLAPPVVGLQWLGSVLPLVPAARDLLVTVLSIAVSYGCWQLYLRWVERREPTELAPRGAVREAGFGILCGVSLFSGTLLVLAMFGACRIEGMNDIAVMLAPLPGALLSGYFEELLIRGILFRIIEESLGTWLALAISAVIFGLLHLGNAHATLLGAASIALEAGILLAAAYLYTRRLWLAMGLHFAWNYTQAGIFGIAVSGNQAMPGLLRTKLSGPAWLSGGEFGAEASLVAVLLCLVAGVAFLFGARRRGNLRAPFWRRAARG